VQTLELEASDESTLLIATFDARTSVAIGEVVALTIDPHAVHFFDLETAAVIGAATTAPVPA
jgi:hypothetical protein